MITDEHRAFAREMVALARRHRMTDLRLSFRVSVGHPTLRGPGIWGEVIMNWAEGRHAASSEIKLQASVTQHISETLEHHHG